MARCVYCQADVEESTRFCRACGRMQPSGPITVPPISASGPLVRACPECGQAAELEDRFCMRCAYPLRQSCRICKQEAPIWARFCPNCGAVFAHVGAQPEARQERQTLVGFGLPEGASAPGVSGVPTGSQIGAPAVSGVPAGSQTGLPGVPGASAGPQSGAPGVPSAPAGPQSGAPGMSGAPTGSQIGTTVRLAGHSASKAIGRSLGARLLGTAAGKVIAAAIAVMVVAAGGTAAAVAVGHNPIATAFQRITGHGAQPVPPPPPELTYIGSDGNIWDVTLPKGTPRHLTTDANPGNPTTGLGSIMYSGLAWSPDGKRLAVIRATNTYSASAAYALLIFSPKGSVLWKQALPQSPLSDSLVWSPDGRLIAYTQATQNYSYGPNGSDLEGALVIINASTGSITNTLHYDAGPTGTCGGGTDALTGLVWSAHHARMGVNTFDWSRDGQKLLVAFNDSGSESALVFLNTGATTSGYPEGASFQPGGQFILGSGNYDAPLELTNLAGQQVRILENNPRASANSPYANDLGQATWSSDGKAIYYEYQDGIWRVNVDGSGARQIVAGTQIVNNQVTVELAPRLSPDGSRLLYLEAQAVIDPTGSTSGSVTAQWYIALADGSSALALPHGIIAEQPQTVEAVWRPA